MVLFDQMTFSDPKAGSYGDCMRACVATLLQVHPRNMPHPIDAGAYNQDFFDFLDEQFGITHHIRVFKTGRDMEDLPRVIIAGGITTRTDPETLRPAHAVLWDRTAHRLLHDPHPSRSGLTKIETFEWLERFGRRVGQ